MTTVLQYLVIAAVIGLVVFALAVFVFGRGEQLAPLSPRVSPTELPDREMTAEDVRKVRFAMALRGYRMSDVDWALERMADEVDRLRRTIAGLSGQTAGAQPQSDETTPAELSDDSSPGEPGIPGAAAVRVGSTETGSGTGPVLAGAARSGSARHLRSDADRTASQQHTDPGSNPGDTP